MIIKLDLEYAGEAFCGWQRQPAKITVQGELERALGVILGALAKRAGLQLERAVAVVGSGRTDAGVHARGQAASFFWPNELEFNERRLLGGLNALTPPQLVVHRARMVEEGFDARLRPHVKCYCYRMLLRGFSAGYFLNRVWCLAPPLDVPAMVKAARIFRGQHDFQSFRARDCTASTTVRTIVTSELSRQGSDELVYTACGKGFLKNMIRIIVGTLVDVGRGRLSVEDVQRILLSRDRRLAGVTAPPQGLTLEWVRYLDGQKGGLNGEEGEA